MSTVSTHSQHHRHWTFVTLNSYKKHMRSDVKGEQEGEHTTQLVTVNLSLLTTVDETQVGAAFSDWINNKSLHILLRWTQNLYEQNNFFPKLFALSESSVCISRRSTQGLNACLVSICPHADILTVNKGWHRIQVPWLHLKADFRQELKRRKTFPISWLSWH